APSPRGKLHAAIPLPQVLEQVCDRAARARALERDGDERELLAGTHRVGRRAQEEEAVALQRGLDVEAAAGRELEVRGDRARVAREEQEVARELGREDVDRERAGVGRAREGDAR